MLSSVLNSEKAIEVNIAILRCFILLQKTTEASSDTLKMLVALSNKYHKSLNEIFAILEIVTKTIERQHEKRNGSLSTLKQTYQRELTKKILLRRLR